MQAVIGILIFTTGTKEALISVMLEIASTYVGIYKWFFTNLLKERIFIISSPVKKNMVRKPADLKIVSEGQVTAPRPRLKKQWKIEILSVFSVVICKTCYVNNSVNYDESIKNSITLIYSSKLQGN